MNKKKKLGALLGAVVSAATLLSLAPFGVANASDSKVEMPADGGNDATLTIKGTADYVAGHTFAAVRIGTYALASKNSNNKLTGLAVDTVSDSNVKTAAQAALISASSTSEPEKEYIDNPVGEVASKWLGFDDPASTGNTDKTSASRDAAYAGDLRNFVTALNRNSTFTALFDNSHYATTVTGAAKTDNVTISGLKQGLYVVRDITANPIKDVTSTLSIPMLVGTAVGVDKLDAFADGTQTLGEVEVKDDAPSLMKRRTDDIKHPKTNDVLDYEIDTNVPLTTGYDTYKFIVYDEATKGLTFDPDSLSITIGKTDVTNRSDVYKMASETNSKDGSVKTSFDFSGNIFIDTKTHPSEFKYNEPIVITYSMTFNGSEVNPSNKAWLETSYDSNHSGGSTPGLPPSKPTPPTHTVSTYTFGFQMNDTLRNNPGTLLTGEGFKIYEGNSVDSSKEVKFVKDGDNPGVYRVRADADTAPAEPSLTVATEDNAVVKKGNLKVSGLYEDTYTVQQTDPAWRLQSDESSKSGEKPQRLRALLLPTFQVQINAKTHDEHGLANTSDATLAVTPDSWNLVSKDASDGVVKVTNATAVSQLPLTGGAGVVLAVAIIAVLALMAVAVTVVKRRHQAARRI